MWCSRVFSKESRTEPRPQGCGRDQGRPRQRLQLPGRVRPSPPARARSVVVALGSDTLGPVSIHIHFHRAPLLVDYVSHGGCHVLALR